MGGMTCFLKRVVCLAAVVGLLGVTGAEAAKFVVTEGSESGRFTAKNIFRILNLEVVLSKIENASLDSTINFIRTQSDGKAVEIDFDTTGGGVNIGKNTISITQKIEVLPRWGDVKVTGSLTSTDRDALSLISYPAALNVTVSGKISTDGIGDAVFVSGRVALRMDACTLTTLGGSAVRNVEDNTSSSVEINGGKFKSIGGNVVYNLRGSVKIKGGEFESGTGYAVYAGGSLNINGGRFVSNKAAVYSDSVFTIVNGEFVSGSGTALSVSGTGEIRGGSFNSTDGGAALNVTSGNVLVSRGTVFVNNSNTSATIQISEGSVRFANVDIENKNRNGRAVFITSRYGKIVLEGSVSPYIKGNIASRYIGTISVNSEFRPDAAGYTLEYVGGSYVDSAVAVVGGGEYYESFRCANRYYKSSTRNGDIIIVLKADTDALKYVVTGDTLNGFVASIENKTANTWIGRGIDVATVIDSIRISADGRPCGIKFGDGESVLNAGRVNGIRFEVADNGSGWGRVTLSGKMSNTKLGGRGVTYALYVDGGVLVESNLDISEANGHSGSIFVGAGSGYIHNSGNLCSRIVNNGGTVTIAGGTITADTGYAVVNNGGRVVISGDAEITAASPNGAVYIGPNGYLYLYGGTVSSIAAVNGDSAAKAIVAYAGDSRDTAGRIEMCGFPAVDGIISLPGGDESPIRITIGDGYVFDPPKNEIYRIEMPAFDGGSVVENGAGFIHSFALDPVGNAGLKLAIDGNDVVAAKKTCNISFSLNGSLGNMQPPDDILVIKGGTIGGSARPSTEEYISATGYYNDSKWYIRTGISADGDQMSTSFRFSDENGGSSVEKDEVLTLFWTDRRAISVLESTRDLPVARNTETVAIAPVAAASGSLTAGPSPVSGSSGAVNFYRSGAALKSGKLFIYDASGNMIAKVAVNDPTGNTGRRSVAKWNLQDAKGRQATEGTYVARGVITTKAGKIERVSILISVQR